jgi:hypothetical protein
MNGITSGFQAQDITIVLYEHPYVPSSVPLERVIFNNRIDEATREYLREKAMVERMHARRLFCDED